MTSSRLTAEERAFNAHYNFGLLDGFVVVALFPLLFLFYLWEKLRGKND